MLQMDKARAIDYMQERFGGVSLTQNDILIMYRWLENCTYDQAIGEIDTVRWEHQYNTFPYPKVKKAFQKYKKGDSSAPLDYFVWQYHGGSCKYPTLDKGYFVKVHYKPTKKKAVDLETAALGWKTKHMGCNNPTTCECAGGMWLLHLNPDMEDMRIQRAEMMGAKNVLSPKDLINGIGKMPKTEVDDGPERAKQITALKKECSGPDKRLVGVEQ